MAAVQARVSAYNFNRELNELLDKVERELGSKRDKFDEAALLKHLRTFYEKLHQHVAQTLRERKPESGDNAALDNFGNTLRYLFRRGLLTQKMNDFAGSLYGVLSNDGVHAIKAEREYVRLCRNMVAEYALVLFFELDRRIAH